MSAVGIVVHNHREDALELAARAVAFLHGNGHRVFLPTCDAALIGRSELGRAESDFGHGLVLALSLGGDGTMLRTIDLVAGSGTPVLGINVGQLGYLTETEPEDLEQAVSDFFAGVHNVEHRMMVAITADAPSGSLPPGEVYHALNEGVVEKTPLGHTVRLSVAIDGEFFTTYAADGMILATPTGSTAYSFSARGPIVAPSHRAMVMTPVSPHMLFDRAMVLEPDTVMRLEVIGHRPATLSVDGRTIGELVEGDAVEFTASDRTACLVTFGPRNFHGILKAKFGLNDR